MLDPPVPVIRFFDLLLVPMQGEISDRAAIQLKDAISHKIETSAPRGLVIDVSGISVLDSYISRIIHDIGVMSRLMGVETVVCGIDPVFAITLVEMGMSLEQVATEMSLEAAVERLGIVCRRVQEPGGGRDQASGD